MLEFLLFFFCFLFLFSFLINIIIYDAHIVLRYEDYLGIIVFDLTIIAILLRLYKKNSTMKRCSWDGKNKTN